MNTNPEDTTPKPTPVSVPDPSPVSESEALAVEIYHGEEAPPIAFDVDDQVRKTVEIISNGLSYAKKGWKEILVGSLRWNWLKLQHNSQGARNDLVSYEMKSGFGLVLNQLPVSRATAYRWIDRAMEFAVEIGVTDQNFPLPDSDEWVRMVEYLRGRIEILELLELPIRSLPIPEDDEVMVRLRAAAEFGHDGARQLLMQLESGEVSKDEATRRYCQKEKTGNRSEPALLTLDRKKLRPKGASVKALVTVKSLFVQWYQLPEEARIQIQPLVREVFAIMPKECGIRKLG
jgi:hypothetical protein